MRNVFIYFYQNQKHERSYNILFKYYGMVSAINKTNFKSSEDSTLVLGDGSTELNCSELNQKAIQGNKGRVFNGLCLFS